MAHLAALDLRLLQVLEALLIERNVTRAAERVGMAQPSLSNALSRLRHIFDDELFVRTPKAMRPTARALSLARPLQEVLEGMRRLVDSDAPFDPAQCERRFSIGVAPFATYVMMPPLIRMLRRELPKATVRFRSLEFQEELELLDEERIDLAIGVLPDLPKRFATCTLFRDRAVCIARRGNPALRKGLTLERFLAAPHAHATNYIEATVDAALAEQKLERRVAVLGHSYQAIAVAVAHSDLLAIVPARAAADLARREPIDVHELPVAVPEQPIGIGWSRHGESDPAIRWLREGISRLFAEEDAARGEAAGTRRARPRHATATAVSRSA